MEQELNIKAWMSAAAIFWGGYIFLAALFEMGGINFYWFNGKLFALLLATYPGLSATITGSFIGLIHGIFCGALCAGIFVLLHNVILRRLS